MRSRGQAGLASHRFPKGRRLENLKGGQRTGWQPGKDLGWGRHPSGLRYQKGQRQTNLCLDDRKCVTCGMLRQSTEQNAKR